MSQAQSAKTFFADAYRRRSGETDITMKEKTSMVRTEGEIGFPFGKRDCLGEPVSDFCAKQQRDVSSC